MLKVGDKIVCVVKNIGELTYGKAYTILTIRNSDICIDDDQGFGWWFGQVGYTEPWTIFFVTKQEWDRNKILDQIINE